MNQHFDWDLDKLSKNQKKIANFIEKNTNRIAYLTEQEMADQVRVSIASISRFWRVIGYKNFKEFKQMLADNPDITPAYKIQNLINKVDGEDLPGQMLKLGVQYLTETADALSRPDFHRAIAALREAQRIYVYAPGPSQGLGELLSFRLKRYGMHIINMGMGGHEMYESLMHLQPADVVVVFGFSNILPETKAIMQIGKQVGYKTVFITDFMVSDMLNEADIVLYTYRGKLSDFHSMVAPTVLVESLIVGVGQAEKENIIPKLNYLNQLRKQYASLIPK
ncbi:MULTISPECIES: MurR/RpiR family transcriptional regulator [Paenibacillus]|uniref:MurR/RpiR family transcriptional regulator n=1 Tax=Paenibacillus TaxID=44249 RepID=UPI00039ED85F|nr:MurR/RpiR family transcriptional regulator [Paenibacillus massiliensis]